MLNCELNCYKSLPEHLGQIYKCFVLLALKMWIGWALLKMLSEKLLMERHGQRYFCNWPYYICIRSFPFKLQNMGEGNISINNAKICGCQFTANCTIAQHWAKKKKKACLNFAELLWAQEIHWERACGQSWAHTVQIFVCSLIFSLQNIFFVPLCSQDLQKESMW